MAKRLLIFVFCILSFPLGAWSAERPRALFVSVVQDPPVLSSRQAIDELIEFSRQARFKVLFVQIYHGGQAWFRSRVADQGPYEHSFKSLHEDPLALLIKQAHAKGIEVHAWLNLMSLGANTNAPFLKKYGPAILTRNLSEKHGIEDFKIDGQYFLEPGDPRVEDGLSKIVEEILRAYPQLDGIQFDYIRYPDVEPHYGYTPANMARFKKASGLTSIKDDSLVWKDWKRSRVTAVLTRLVRLVRTRQPHFQVSTTGCMPYVRAYEEAFQDWGGWLTTRLIDFVTIMDYSTDLNEFERWVASVKEKTGDLSKVNISVGAYKMVDTPVQFEAEFQACVQMGAGCAVFHYGSVLKSAQIQSFLTNKNK